MKYHSQIGAAPFCIFVLPGGYGVGKEIVQLLLGGENSQIHIVGHSFCQGIWNRTMHLDGIAVFGQQLLMGQLEILAIAATGEDAVVVRAGWL